MVAAFSVTSQANRIRFFEKTFLVANVSPEVILGMPFLTLSSADIDFPKRKLWWRSYTIKKAFSITKRVELVGKKEFIAAVLDLEHETFIVNIASLESPSQAQESNIYPSCRTQIAALVANEAPTSIPTKYSNFANVFSPKLALELLEHIRINDHAIELVNN